MKVIKVKNWLKIGNDYYKPEHDEKSGGWNFMKVSKKEVKEFDNLRKEIIKKVVSSVSPEQVLDDALSELTLEDLKGIYHNLYKAKRKPKPRVKPGCLELTVGKYAIPIR